MVCYQHCYGSRLKSAKPSQLVRKRNVKTNASPERRCEKKPNEQSRVAKFLNDLALQHH